MRTFEETIEEQLQNATTHEELKELCEHFAYQLRQYNRMMMLMEEKIINKIGLTEYQKLSTQVAEELSGAKKSEEWDKEREKLYDALFNEDGDDVVCAQEKTVASDDPDILIIKQTDFYKEFIDKLYYCQEEPDVIFFEAKKSYTSSDHRKADRDLEIAGCTRTLEDRVGAYADTDAYMIFYDLKEIK